MTDIELFNIRNGNVCSLCEKPLNWLAKTEKEYLDDLSGVIIHLDMPIVLDVKRAICNVCYNNLKARYG